MICPECDGSGGLQITDGRGGVDLDMCPVCETIGKITHEKYCEVYCKISKEERSHSAELADKLSEAIGIISMADIDHQLTEQIGLIEEVEVTLRGKISNSLPSGKQHLQCKIEPCKDGEHLYKSDSTNCEKCGMPGPTSPVQ